MRRAIASLLSRGRRLKYGNRKTAGSASKREAKRLAELRLMEKSGEIYNLQTQVKFELIPAQYVDGRCVERPCSYVADFVYTTTPGAPCDYKNLVVEDAKGVRTRDYVIKRKLMLYLFGISIKEV